MFDTNIETEDLAKAIKTLVGGNLKTENLKAIIDRDGVVHTIQMGLFMKATDAYYRKNEHPQCYIKLLDGSEFKVALTGKEVAEQLGVNVPTTDFSENAYNTRHSE